MQQTLINSNLKRKTINKNIFISTIWLRTKLHEVIALEPLSNFASRNHSWHRQKLACRVRKETFTTYNYRGSKE